MIAANLPPGAPLRIMASNFPYVPAVLPLSFYNIHESCPAIFSTRLQTLPKRALVEPFPCPIIRSNIQLDIGEKVQQLRDQFPDHARYVQPVRNWLDLHHYFDAVDLYSLADLQCRKLRMNTESMLISIDMLLIGWNLISTRLPL